MDIFKNIFGFFNKKTTEKEKEIDPNTVNAALEFFTKMYIEHINGGDISQFTTGADTVEVEQQAGEGRSSISQDYNIFSFKGQVISTDFNHEVIKLIEQFAIGNRHLAYALENLVTLANTEYTIDFSQSVPESQKERMIQYLNSESAGWYQFSNLEGLINDLFYQVGTFGAISYEAYPTPNLRALDQVVLVSPIEIYFQYDNEVERYITLQDPQNGAIIGKKSDYGYVELNTRQHYWSPIRRWKNQPYAVPPFISALEDLCLENDMLKTFKAMMDRAGMLGFLSLLLKPPTQRDDETPEEYSKRVNDYIKNNTKAADRAFSKGVFVGTQGGAEIEATANDVNMEGGKTALDMVKRLIYAGLKQDPSLHGENFSTTESFAKVLLEKMTNQVDNYQKHVSAALEHLFIQALKYGGFDLSGDAITVKFSSASLGDEKKQEETLKLRSERAAFMQDRGWISQDEAAQMQGLDSAYLEKAPSQAVETEDNQETTENKMVLDAKKLQDQFKSTHEFDYHIPEGCAPDQFENTNFDDSFLTQTNNLYVNKVEANYRKYTAKAGRNYSKTLSTLSANSSLATVQAAARLAMFGNWESDFVAKNEPYTNKYVEDMYVHFRKDDKVFSLAKSFHNNTQSFEDFEVPEATFNQFDTRTITYLQNSDDFYLGKFITDSDTIARANQWVLEKFEAGEVPIGADAQGFKDFANEFSDALNLEQWKIRRVIETTSNKARTYASVAYIKQAKILKYEIVEILDNRTCNWCNKMDGKTFSVTSASQKIEQLTNAPVSEIGNISQFATSVPIKEFEQLTNDELQARGFTLTPNHPFCRGRIVSVI